MKKCTQCGQNFKQYHTINEKRVRLRNRNKCLNCLPYKEQKAQKNIMTECKTCGKKIQKTIREIEKTKNNFCSRSCAATYNNKNYLKRKLTKKCKTCDNRIYAKQVFCSFCKDKNSILLKKLSDYTHIPGANRYRSIRDHARKIMSDKPQKCWICGYSTHVETCHIKDIQNFSPDAKVSEINHPNNLILLCKNHHWELDNNILCILR